MECYWCFCCNTQCNAWPQCWSTLWLPINISLIKHTHKPQAKYTTEHHLHKSEYRSFESQWVHLTKLFLDLLLLYCTTKPVRTFCSVWLYFRYRKCWTGFIWIIGLCSCRRKPWKHTDESSCHGKIATSHWDNTHTHKCKGSE